MKKTYKSSTILTILLANGRRVSFEPTSDEGSTFSTENVKIQRMLEEHPMFGSQFRFDRSTLRDMRIASQQAATAPAPAEPAIPGQSAQPSPQAPAAPCVKEVVVSGMADAKEYLVNNFGIYRSYLRTKKDILENAAQNNIKFVGL